MRKIGMALAVASMAMVAAAAPSTGKTGIVPTQQTLVEEKKAKRMRQAVAAGSLARRIRSRGPQAKPKRRSNRNLVSKRVRRKHRRAA